MKPDLKSEYEVSFYGSETKAIVYFSFWKEYASGDYDVPSDPATIEIDKIEINNVDMTDILFETEKARFPETMPLVVRYRNLEKWKKENWEDRRKIEELRAQIWRLEVNIRERNQKIQNSEYIKERKQFIKSKNLKGKVGLAV